MQCFGGLVSASVSEGEEEAAVLPTLPPITWADCRAEREAGRQPYSPFIRTSLQMVCWECCLIRMLRGWTVASGSNTHTFIHAVKIILHAVWKSDLPVVCWISSHFVSITVNRSQPHYIFSLNNLALIWEAKRCHTYDFEFRVCNS